MYIYFFYSIIRHTRWPRDWSSDVCSSDLFLGSVCSSFVDAFEDGLWSSVNEVFCVFQTQGGQRTYFFNDTDLGIAGSFENNIEFGLFCSFAFIVAATSWGSSHCNWSSSGYVEFFFKSLDEFGQF